MMNGLNTEFIDLMNKLGKQYFTHHTHMTDEYDDIYGYNILKIETHDDDSEIESYKFGNQWASKWQRTQYR